MDYCERIYKSGTRRTANVNAVIDYGLLARLTCLVRATDSSLSSIVRDCVKSGIARYARKVGVELPEVGRLTREEYLAMVGNVGIPENPRNDKRTKRRRT